MATPATVFGAQPGASLITYHMADFTRPLPPAAISPPSFYPQNYSSSENIKGTYVYTIGIKTRTHTYKILYIAEIKETTCYLRALMSIKASSSQLPFDPGGYLQSDEISQDNKLLALNDAVNPPKCHVHASQLPKLSKVTHLVLRVIDQQNKLFEIPLHELKQPIPLETKVNYSSLKACFDAYLQEFPPLTPKKDGPGFTYGAFQRSPPVDVGLSPTAGAAGQFAFVAAPPLNTTQLLLNPAPYTTPTPTSDPAFLYAGHRSSSENTGLVQTKRKCCCCWLRR